MNIRTRLAATTLLLASLPASGQQPAVVESLPPLRYASTLDGDSPYDQVKASPLFAKLDKELVGSPILLRVSHSLQPTAGGTAAGLTSAILAGSSLGILPVVTNNDLVLTYEVMVHDTVLASFSYRENFTEATNLFTAKGMGQLSPSAQTWVRGTAERFIADATGNQALRDLQTEYRYYFGTP